MRRIQFGAGSLHIPGFENYDMDVDITKPLPQDRFPDASADIVFSEMCIEHVAPQQAWLFLEECHRILKPSGLIRVVIPDFVRCWKLKDEEWLRVNQGVTNNDGSLKDQMKSIIFAHGHLGLWSAELMSSVLEAIGFVDVSIHEAGLSHRPEMVGLEQHQHSVGKRVAFAESGCVEGVRP